MRRRQLALLLAPVALFLGCSEGGGGGGEGYEDPFAGLEVDHEIALSNLEGRVEVLRDPNGVAHIFCQYELDCIRAQGFVQAHDRFFQMDFFRSLASGRLGRAVGRIPQARGPDRFYRRMMTASDGRPVVEHIEESLSPETRAFVQAFADGVNDYLAVMGKAPWAPVPDEYASPFIVYGQDLIDGNYQPEPWTVTDTLHIARFFTFVLSDRFDEELRLADYAARLDPQMFSDLLPVQPLDPTFAVPGFYERRNLGRPFRLRAETAQAVARVRPLIEGLRSQREAMGALRNPFGEWPGSNNWIVHSSKSETGNPLVANDPHLSLTAPALWWETHLDAVSLPGATGELKVKGVIFPGTPGVIIGHTQHLAWGDTVVGYDVTDLYVEEVAGVDQVLFEGQPVQVVKTVVRFPVGPGPDDYDEEKICVVPHHGPIMVADGMTDDELADPDLPCVDPARGAKALSVRWVGQMPTQELDVVWRLLHAKDVDEAKAALDDWGVGAQNWVVGDTAGNILYYPRALVPIRKWDLEQAPPFLPLPGTGKYEWSGWIPNEDIPQAKNPSAGFVVTANADIAGVTEDGNPLNDPYYLYWGVDLGLRAGRITRLLEKALEDGVVTVEEMKAIQNDDYWELAELLVPYILAAADSRPDLVSGLDLDGAIARLRAWNFETPTGLATDDPDGPLSMDTKEVSDAVAASLFGAWYYAVLDRTYLDELVAAGVVQGRQAPTDQPFQKALYFMLRDGNDTYWDDVSTPEKETQEDVLLKALRDAMDRLETAIGGPMDEWVWGRVHVMPLYSPFGQLGAPTDDYQYAPRANGGGMHSIDVANYNRNFEQHAGPSLRIVTDVSPDGVRSWQVIPGGIVDDMGDPNREDQLSLWLAGEYKALPFDAAGALEAAKVRAATNLPDGARWTAGAPKIR